MANDRHYYIDGGEQLWRIAPGEAPREYTEADGWRPLQIWGMGIASQDLTGDGRPEVFITSQGDNKLQTLDDGSDATVVPRHRPRARCHRPAPVHRRRRAPVDGVAPRVRGREQRRLHRPVRQQGERRGAGRQRRPRSEQPAHRPGRRHLRGRSRGGGHRQLRPGPRRRARRPQPRRHARPRRRQSPEEHHPVAERRPR